MISRSELIDELEATRGAYFPDDPDQFTVRAIGAVLNYLGDREIAYHVGRVLRWSVSLPTYVAAEFGPDIAEGEGLVGLQQACEEEAYDPWYGPE